MTNQAVSMPGVGGAQQAAMQSMLQNNAAAFQKQMPL